jgi:phenylacetate-CoA ligase
MLNPRIESMPVGELRALQLTRLQEMLERIDARVPFYRSLLAASGVTPRDLRSLSDLERFPFTRKVHFRDQYPFGLMAVPRTELRRIHASSGTTGKPTVIGYDANDLDIFASVVARSLYAAGARAGMGFHNAYGYGLFTGGLGLHAGAEQLGLAVIPASGGMTNRQVTLIEDLQPEVLACTPSYALVLADALAARGHSPSDISLKYAVMGAEPWSESIRNEVEAKLGVRATNIYGLSETIGPGVSCEDASERRGSYVWEDHFYPEVVHPDTGVPLPDGEYGVLVLTSMTRTATPVLRYWTGDITRLLAEENSTGRTMRRMDMIRGRSDDLIILRGVNVYPGQVAAALDHLPGLQPHYQFVLKRSGRMDELTLRIESTRRDGALVEEIISTVKDGVGVTISCELCEPGTLPRSEGGKVSRLVDLRSP